MDDKELAKISKEQDTIIIFALGNKYAWHMHHISEQHIEAMFKRIQRKIIKDFQNQSETPESRTFVLHVIQGPDGTPCPERTCVHSFHSDDVMTDHVKANHPRLFAELVSKNRIVEIKETKTVTYL